VLSVEVLDEAAPPNTRVQRTRSSASPPHPPLSRQPLGARGHAAVAVDPTIRRAVGLWRCDRIDPS
jgi:hypothetical protein